MPDTSFEPGTTVNPAKDSPKRNGTAHSTSVKPGLLVVPSTGTYKNGYEVMSAAYGDSNTGEGFPYQVEIPAIHPQSTTAHDKTTAYAAGDTLSVIKHRIGSSYWLKGSSLTVTKGDKVIAAANGLVAKQTAHTASALPHHTWIANDTYSAKTWIKGTYIGITSMYTANT